MHACRAARERDVEALVDDDRDLQCRDQRTPDFHQYAGIHMFQSKQQHRRPTTFCRHRTRYQTTGTVTQVVGNRAEAQTQVIVLDHSGEPVDDIVPLMLSSWLSGTPTDQTPSVAVAIRLATTCREDSPSAIADAVTELVHAFHERNDVGPNAIRLVIFTATPDLKSAKPAAAARAAGWGAAQYLCLAEMPTDTDLPRCIRVLLIVDRGRGADKLRSVYINGAQALRPDVSFE